MFLLASLKAFALSEDKDEEDLDEDEEDFLERVPPSLETFFR